MSYTILDCYTDEAAGLGVPPYLGTYPRYIFGLLMAEGKKVNYITIDDLRFSRIYKNRHKKEEKTNIKIYNLTREDVAKILLETDTLIVNLGVHVPGKYLSAVPGTLREVVPLIKDLNCKKILTGPAIFGTQLEGGKYYEKTDTKLFDEVKQFGFEFGGFEKLQKYSLLGAHIIKQIPYPLMIEIETGRGCNVGRCSFCTEPLKNKFINRKTEDILEEVKEFYDLGCRFFRLGKQADFYSIEDPIRLLKGIREKCPDIKILHLDNVNPVFVINEKGIEITKAIVKYCSSGNVAAFGVESFDPLVVKENTLNCTPGIAMKAIKILNELGSARGEDGMPKYLPGLNIIYGLGFESRKTHEYNIQALKQIYDNGWMLRRINIRQAAILPGTMMEQKFGKKYYRKNKRYYWKWRDDIRQNIDFPMLQRVVPKGTILKNIYTEIHDGNTTFGRQFGTYPLIVGIKGKLPLKQFISVKVTDHMLRSVSGEQVNG